MTDSEPTEDELTGHEPTGNGSTDGDPDAPPARFLLDAMLGKLATYLRMCGYDAAYALDRGMEDDDRLRDLAAAEGRRLLTRDADLAARTPDALLIEALDVEGQLREFRAAGYDLVPAAEPERCGACNGPLARVDPGRGTPPYAPDPDAENVWRCGACGQHFWKGSHWRDVVERLDSL